MPLTAYDLFAQQAATQDAADAAPVQPKTSFMPRGRAITAGVGDVVAGLGRTFNSESLTASGQRMQATGETPEDAGAFQKYGEAALRGAGAGAAVKAAELAGGATGALVGSAILPAVGTATGAAVGSTVAGLVAAHGFARDAADAAYKNVAEHGGSPIEAQVSRVTSYALNAGALLIGKGGVGGVSPASILDPAKIAGGSLAEFGKTTAKAAAVNAGTIGTIGALDVAQQKALGGEGDVAEGFAMGAAGGAGMAPLHALSLHKAAAELRDTAAKRAAAREDFAARRQALIDELGSDTPNFDRWLQQEQGAKLEREGEYGPTAPTDVRDFVAKFQGPELTNDALARHPEFALEPTERVVGPESLPADSGEPVALDQRQLALDFAAERRPEFTLEPTAEVAGPERALAEATRRSVAGEQQSLPGMEPVGENLTRLPRWARDAVASGDMDALRREYIARDGDNARGAWPAKVAEIYRARTNKEIVEVKDAVQEPIATGVDARLQPTDGREMGGRNAEGREVAGKVTPAVDTRAEQTSEPGAASPEIVAPTARIRTARGERAAKEVTPPPAQRTIAEELALAHEAEQARSAADNAVEAERYAQAERAAQDEHIANEIVRKEQLTEHYRKIFLAASNKSLADNFDKDWAQHHAVLQDAATIGEALARVKEAGAGTHEALVDKLLANDAIKDLKFSLHDQLLKADRADGGMDVMKGVHDEATGQVVVGHGGGFDTALHEIVHAATVKGLAENKAFADEVKTLYGLAKDRLAKDAAYGLKNEKEFLAEAHTNKTFQDLLRRIPAPGGQTVWSRFVGAVKRLLGMARAPASLLDKVLAASESEIKSGGGAMGGERAVNAAVLGGTGRVTAESRRVADGILDKLKDAATSAAAVKSALYIAPLDKIAKACAEKGLSTAPQEYKNALERRKAEVHREVAKTHYVFRQAMQWAEGIRNIPARARARVLQASVQQRATLLKIDPRIDITRPLEDSPWYKNGSAFEKSSLKRSYDSEKARYEGLDVGGREVYARERKALMDDWKKLGNFRAEVEGARAHASKESITGQDVFHRIEMRQKQGAHDQLAAAVRKVGEMFKEHLPKGVDFATADVEVLRKALSVGHTRADVAEHTRLSNERRALEAAGKPVPADLVSQIERVTPKVDKAVYDALTHLTDSMQNIMAGPYFSMDRPGKYRIKFHDEHGVMGEPGANWAEHYETEAEFKKAHAEFAAKGLDKTEGYTAQLLSDVDQQPRASEQGMRAFITAAKERVAAQIGDAEQASQFMDALDTILGQAMLDTQATSSWKRYMAQRKGYLGASMDYERAFVKRMNASHQNIATLRTSAQIEKAFEQLTTEISTASTTAEGVAADPNKAVALRLVRDELTRRYNGLFAEEATPGQDKVSAAAYLWGITGAPAYLITNLVQPFMTAVPYLSRIEGVSAVRAVRNMMAAEGEAFKAVSLLWKSGKWNPVFDFSEQELVAAKLSKDHAKLIAFLGNSGKLEATAANEMADVAGGRAMYQQTEFMGVKDAAKVTGAAVEGVRRANLIAHYTEMQNRIATAIAAYDLAGAKLGKDATIEAKYELARDAIDSTQYDLSREGRARVLSKQGVFGKRTPLLTMYYNFKLNTMANMGYSMLNALGMGGRNATESATLAAEGRKHLLGVFAATALFAGVSQMPGMGMLQQLYNMLAGDDENGNPPDAAAAVRETIANVVGTGALGRAAAYGVPAAFGVNVSGNVGLGDLIPGTRLLAEHRHGKDLIEAGVLEAAGPAAGVAKNFVAGVGKVAEGNWVKGVEQMLPRAVAGLAKGVEMVSTGEVTDANGLPTGTEVGLGDAAVQALGFRPNAAVERSELLQETHARNTVQQDRMHQLRTQWLSATLAGDAAAAEEAIAQWNETHPAWRITRQSLIKAYRTHLQSVQQTQQGGLGVPVPPKHAARYADMVNLAGD